MGVSMKKCTFILWVILILFIISPILILLLRSFAVGWNWGQLIPLDISLEGWKALFSDPLVQKAIITSILISLMTIFLNFLISFPAAKVLSFQNFRGKAFVETFLSLPILIPSLAIVMGVHLTMIKLGLTDHLLGVSLVHLIPTIPYSIKIVRAGFENIGPYWEQQARTLGGSNLSFIFHIYIPLMLPSIRTVIFLVTVISLSQYALTALIGGGNVMTLSIVYFPYLSTVNETMIASFSLLFAVIPVIILVLIELLITLIVPYRKWRKVGENLES
jgi:putative spermidine/putrescine transport system permease protein